MSKSNKIMNVRWVGDSLLTNPGEVLVGGIFNRWIGSSTTNIKLGLYCAFKGCGYMHNGKDTRLKNEAGGDTFDTLEEAKYAVELELGIRDGAIS